MCNYNYYMCYQYVCIVMESSRIYICDAKILVKVHWNQWQVQIIFFQVNNYIVRSYRDVIVVVNIVTRRTTKA